MSASIYFQYNPWWENEPRKALIVREKPLQICIESLQSDRAVFVSGLRRVGKTSILKLVVYHLIDQGVDPKHILYVSLDDYLLKDKTIHDILDDYLALHKISMDTQLYVFLDEVTFQQDFQHQIKTIYDRMQIKVFASSSSASMLKDPDAFLTGRLQTIEILPLDFEEYLSFKNISLSPKDAAAKAGYFEDYLHDGGMPEYVLTKSREYLVTLTNNIISRDIIAHHGIKNEQLIRDYFALLMERAGKQISINKVARILGISPDSAKRYLQMFQDTYLIFLLPRYGKTNERLLAQKKVYSCDLGIRNIITGFRDKGSLFENYAYLKLKNQGLSYVYKDGNEIDFMTQDQHLIEVKYHRELSDKQQALFNSFPCKQRSMIQRFDDPLLK